MFVSEKNTQFSPSQSQTNQTTETIETEPSIDPIDEFESLNNKTDIYRIRPSDSHMFENRKWFVKEKLEPEEIEAARLYQQEALRDQLEALRGPAGRVQKQENLIPIVKDPQDPSSFQIDTEKLKRQKEQTQGIPSTEDLIQLSLADVEENHSQVKERTDSYSQLEQTVFEILSEHLNGLMSKETEQTSTAPADPVDSSANRICMGSITIEDPDLLPDTQNLPTKQELKEQLFGGFQEIPPHLQGINLSLYQVEEGLYEYEDEDNDDDRDSGFSPDIFRPPLSQRQAFQGDVGELRENQGLPQDTWAYENGPLILQRDSPPLHFDSEHDRFQYLTDDDDEEERRERTRDLPAFLQDSGYSHSYMNQPFEHKPAEKIKETHPGQLDTSPQMTTQENLLQYLKLQNPAVPSGAPTIREETQMPFRCKIVQALETVTEEFYNLDLVSECFTKTSFFKPVGLLFLFITIFIGEWLQAPSAFITCLWASIVLLAKKVVQDLRHDFQLYFNKRKYRKQLTKATPHLQKWLSIESLREHPDLEEKSRPLPPTGIGGLRMTKPEGVVSHVPRKKVIRIDKIQVSEVSCKLIEDRPFIPILLGGKIEQMALMDSGAQCSSISPELLARLDKIMPIPREKKTYNISGVVPGATVSSEETVILSFTVSSGHEVKNIPCVVLDCGADFLIGSNVIKGRRWGSEWQGDSLFYNLGYKGPSIEAFFLPNSIIKAITMSCLVLMPEERKMIALRVPTLEGFKKTNLHQSDLIVTSAFPEDQDKPGVEVTPCLSRFGKRRKNELLVEVTNKMDHPVFYNEHTEMASIQLFPEKRKKVDLFDITHYRQVATRFSCLPRVNLDRFPLRCHCSIERNPSYITIQLADRYGYTSTTTNLVCQIPEEDTEWSPVTNEVLKPASLEPLAPGLVVQVHKRFLEEKDPDNMEFFITLLVIPDEDGSYSSITPEHMEKTKMKIEKDLRDYSDPPPVYFFLDPLNQLTFSTMSMMVDLHQHFKYRLHPVRPIPAHKNCINFALRFKPDILPGTQVTRLHIQTGTVKPPPDLLAISEETSLFKANILGASLFVFKLGIFLTCHLHMPYGLSESPYRTLWRDRILYITLSELRRLRIPPDIQISIDGDPGSPLAKQEIEAYSRVMQNALNKLPPFLDPHEKCNMYLKLVDEEEIDLSKEEYCSCCLCTMCPCLKSKQKTGALYLLEGNLQNQNRISKEDDSLLSNKRIKDLLHAAIGTFTAVDGAEFDIPLDPLGLVDEEDLHSFMNTHPGFENDNNEEEENEEKIDSFSPPGAEKAIPLPRYSHQTTAPGIPDTFQQGNWRQYIDISSMSQMPSEEHRKKLENLLDRYTNILSCHKTDCRPIYLDEKQVEVDIELTTDKPIFIKPYPIAEKMIKVLDSKIDEMLEKGEIVEVESPYNVPILLTHHNSENKHIDFDKKKFRLCLDLRVVNSLTKFKNLHSHLVKGIEFLYARIKGMRVFTVIDMTKAYRSLIATEKLMQVCAFRTPGSTKYPFHTWAFRSTPDGLATLPGFYTYCIQKALSPRSRQCTLNHIDDLLVASPDWDTHLQDLESVFSDLLKGNFLISVPKLKLGKTEISFLGHIVDGEVLKVPEDRKSYFDALSPPTTKKEMQSLLGVAGYMAHFVDSYHLKTGPLFEALRGKTDKQKFTLNEVQMKAFEELRQSIKKAESLYIVDFNETIFMETDSSLSGTGSILYQEYSDPLALPGSPLKRRIIRYGSRRFSVTESLHHTSLEREAMGVLIGCKTHYFYLYNCPLAVIKTDLKSLITLLSCYNNPDSGRMSLLSHRLYSLPFRWTLTHSAGTDIPLADALSRLYPPYKAAFSDRHMRYPDLKRENIKLPDEWKKTPNLVLKTSDILDAMRHQAVFIEKSSLAVKSKRLKALMDEVILLRDEIGEIEGTKLEKQISAELEMIEKEKENREKDLNMEKAQREKALTGNSAAQISALTAVSSKTMLTPYFFTEKQNQNAKLNSIILHLRTSSQGHPLRKQLMKKYRLLNDSILVTRKDRSLPFDAPGNLRIVCDMKMTLIIMSFLHIMGGHYGINTLARLFSSMYRTEGSVVGCAKIVALGCRACRLHRPVFKKTVPIGRVPLPSEPNHTWHMDYVVWKQETTHKGKKLAAALNIVDLYSNLLISHLTPDQSAETTIKCLKTTFMTIPAPTKIVSDNGPGLCINKKVATFLKSRGVQNITTITPYNSKGNKSERIHRILRETMRLVAETFQRKTIFDMYSTVIEMINSRPLTISNHPNIREALNGENEVVTPFSLHYGSRPPAHPLIPMEDSLEEDKRKQYREKWKNILNEHDRILQAEIDERNKNFKTEEGIQKEDLVLCVNHTSHKENLKYYRRLYQVVDIRKARYYIKPLFSATTNTIAVNGNDLKPYNYSELFELLPDEIRHLMGESLKPEDILKMVENDPAKVPRDFQDWAFLRTPPTMALRKRLSPPSLDSVPAVSISQPGTFSSSSASSGSSGSSSSSGSPPSDHQVPVPIPQANRKTPPFLVRRFGAPYPAQMRQIKPFTTFPLPSEFDRTSVGTGSASLSAIGSQNNSLIGKNKLQQPNLITTAHRVKFEDPRLIKDAAGKILNNPVRRPGFPVLSTRFQQQLDRTHPGGQHNKPKNISAPNNTINDSMDDRDPALVITRPIRIAIRKQNNLPTAPAPSDSVVQATTPPGSPAAQLNTTNNDSRLVKSLEWDYGQNTGNITSASDLSIPRGSDSRFPATPPSTPEPEDNKDPSEYQLKLPPPVPNANRLYFDSTDGTGTFDMETPNQPRTETGHKRTVFSDKKGLPIAVDNTGGEWRLSKRFITDSSKPRHLPFNTSLGTDSSPSDTSSSLLGSAEKTATTKQQPISSTPITGKETKPQFPVTPMNSPLTDSQAVVTRSGRRSTPVNRFGSWDYGTSSSGQDTTPVPNNTEGSFNSSIDQTLPKESHVQKQAKDILSFLDKNESTTTSNQRLKKIIENLFPRLPASMRNTPAEASQTAKKLTEKIMTRLLENPDKGSSLSDTEMDRIVDSIRKPDVQTPGADKTDLASTPLSKTEGKQRIIVPSLFKQIKTTQTLSDLTKLDPDSPAAGHQTFPSPKTTTSSNNNDLSSLARIIKTPKVVFPPRPPSNPATPVVIPILGTPRATTNPTVNPTTPSNTPVLPATTPLIGTGRPKRQKKEPARYGEWTT